MFVKKTTIRQIVSVLSGMNEEIHKLKDKIGTMKLEIVQLESENLWNLQKRTDLFEKLNLCLDRLDILEKKKAKKTTIKTTTKTKRK